MKKLLDTKPLLNLIQSDSPKAFIEPLIASLKDGLTAFIGLLLLMSFLEYVMSIIQGKTAVILGKLDFAISFLGFLLMFAGKLLERVYGKSK